MMMMMMMQKLRADNYGLKVQLEQARMEEHREVGAERKRETVVEMLKFDTKKEKEEKVVLGGDKSLGSGNIETTLAMRRCSSCPTWRRPGTISWRRRWRRANMELLTRRGGGGRCPSRRL